MRSGHVPQPGEHNARSDARHSAQADQAPRLDAQAGQPVVRHDEQCHPDEIARQHMPSRCHGIPPSSPPRLCALPSAAHSFAGHRRGGAALQRTRNATGQIPPLGGTAWSRPTNDRCVHASGTMTNTDRPYITPTRQTAESPDEMHLRKRRVAMLAAPVSAAPVRPRMYQVRRWPLHR